MKVASLSLRDFKRENVEEEMAPHSSILAWKIPWTVESGGLQSMGSQTGLTEQMNTHGRESICVYVHAYVRVCVRACVRAQSRQSLQRHGL